MLMIARAGLHHPPAGLRHPVRAVEVDVDDLAELLRRLARRRDRGAHAGVVNQDVDVAERVERLLDDAGAVVGIVTSAGTAMAAAAVPLDRAAYPPAARRAARQIATSAPAWARASANATPRPEEAR